MLVLIVNIIVKPGAEEEAKECIRKMQELSRKEPGCRFYAGHQSIEDPRRFCFYEQYDDRSALDEHRAAAYFSQYVTERLAHVVETRVQQLFTTVD